MSTLLFINFYMPGDVGVGWGWEGQQFHEGVDTLKSLGMLWCRYNFKVSRKSKPGK